MIDEEITYAEKGYRSTDLSQCSNKPVYAVCEGENCEREGGRGRWIKFKDYRKLCYSCAIKVPRIQNCKTPTKKRECIDDEITFAEKGYRSTDLKQSSAKPVWAICQGEDCQREGGRGRWVVFNQCRDLCPLCARRTEEYRRKVGEKSKGRVCTEDAKIKNSNSNKGRNSGKNNPMYGMNGENAPNYGISPSDETREKMRKAKIGKYCGEENPNWKGGISFDPYCEKFNNEFKEMVREKFGRVCFMCPITEEENGRKLCVHHVNYDKECMCNGKDCEFVPLCDSCHSKTGHNRKLWERLIMNVLWYEGWID